MEKMPNQQHLEHLSSIEDMKQVFDTIAKTHYLFSHQTSEDTAENIYNSSFEVSPGRGISSTLSWVGAESLLNQIERQFQGDAHRGASGMFVLAVPKEVLDTEGSRNKAEALENVLLESPDYGTNNNPNLVIPNEYNFGYLQGENFYYKK